MWYIHTVKYYSGVKDNEILTQVTTWVDLEDIVLSERKQKQKQK